MFEGIYHFRIFYVLFFVYIYIYIFRYICIYIYVYIYICVLGGGIGAGSNRELTPPHHRGSSIALLERVCGARERLATEVESARGAATHPLFCER